MDYSPLRRRLRDLIGGLKDHATHDRLPALCEQLGLPSPDTEASKRDRLYAAFDAAPDADLVDVAKAYLSGFRPSAETRNEVQELVWALSSSPEVPVRFRREVAKALEEEPLYQKPNALMDLLESLFILEDPLDFFHHLRATSNGRSSSGSSKTTTGKRTSFSKNWEPTLAPTSDSCF